MRLIKLRTLFAVTGLAPMLAARAFKQGLLRQTYTNQKQALLWGQTRC